MAARRVKADGPRPAALLQGQGRVFQCRRCGACCQGRGGVRLDQAEARAVAAFLDIGEADFHRLYLAPGEPPWDIGLDEAGYCLFRQFGGLCLIHPIKPSVCRLWPFLPHIRESAFQDARCACPGFKADLTWAEFLGAGHDDG